MIKNKEQAKWTKKLMQNIAKGVDAKLPDGFLYAVLVFPMTNSMIGNYISNANRDDMILALRETANRLELNKKDEPFKFT